MSGKKNNKKTYRKKRKYYKKKNKKSVFRPQNYIKTGFPKTTMVKLRYVDTFQLDPVQGLIAKANFSANNLFDPTVALGGHQPYMFDTWASLYNHYTVVGSKCSATFTTAGGGQAGLNFCGIHLADDTQSTSTITHMMEQGLTKYRKITAQGGSSQSTATVHCNFSAKKFFNITNISDNQQRLGSPVSGAPSEQAYFNVWLGATNNSVDQTAYDVMVKIDYIVLFSEPRELPQS